MAFYFTSDRDQLRRAIKRFREAALARKKIILIVPDPKSKQDRSQKNYAHVLFQILAMETGWTYDYCKYDYFKRSCNPDIFIYDRPNPKTGELTEELRSIEDPGINLTMAIQRMKTRALVDCQVNLPEPNNKAELERYEYLAQFYQYF